MPIYEYQCNACHHHLEAFQKMSDEPLVECPACHQQALTKLVSATSFQLKGTGWYATDFRDKGKPKTKENNEQATNTSTTDNTAKQESNTQTTSNKDTSSSSSDKADSK